MESKTQNRAQPLLTKKWACFKRNTATYLRQSKWAPTSKKEKKLRRECKVLNLRLAKGRECVNWAKNKIPDDQFFGPKGQEKARKPL